MPAFLTFIGVGLLFSSAGKNVSLFWDLVRVQSDPIRNKVSRSLTATG